MAIDLKSIKKEIVKTQALLVDVRELDEWNKEHFKHAFLLPLSSLKANGIPKEFGPELKLYLHCQKGMRAQAAAKILKEGNINAIALEESFEALKSFFKTESNE